MEKDKPEKKEKKEKKERTVILICCCLSNSLILNVQSLLGKIIKDVGDLLKPEGIN